MSLTKVASSMLASGGGAGGSSVGKNYISSYNNGTCNGDFETGNASGWNICSVASITNGVPSTLTLSGSGVTASVINSGQLAGQYSYQTVFSTTSALKGFCSDAFTIDLEDQAKVLTFKFYYNVTANATSGNFSGTSSNTFIVSIYDETTDTFIQPAGLYSMVQSSGSGVATGTFQTPLGSSQYRLVVLCANNPSANITVVWDDFFVGPQISVNAPAMSDWIDKGTVTIGAVTTAPTKGTIVTDKVKMRRVGDSVQLLYQYQQFTAGTAGSGVYLVSLPAGISFDLTKITTLGSASEGTRTPATVIGNGVLGSTAGVGFNANFYCYALNSTQFTCIISSSQNGTGSGDGAVDDPWGSSAYPLSDASFSMKAMITAPIAGWSSNSVASNDTDTRVVAARYITTSGSTGGRLQFNTIDFDTHAAVTTGSSWVYTAPVSGIYKIQAYLNVGANNIGTNSLALYVNNVAVQTIGNSGITGASNTTTQGAASVKLNAGDAFYLAIGGAPVAINNAWITVERLSGPSVITATETVAASYWASANGTSSATSPFNFDAKEYDTHNAVTTGASWKFTAPVSGVYSVSFYTNQNSPGNAVYYKLYKNSTTTSYKPLGYCPATVGLVTSTTSLRLNAGDYIGVYSHISQNYLGNASLNSDYISHISINRIGN